ncbi:MAG: hypothetical protein QNJ32_29450 [Xenococcaceae cyanobacterium MO_167.B27]|nr:hypothetical protein [Xenococcaceae cyanobacterium MO_167.B27]
MLKHSWKITVPVTIIVIFFFGITVYLLNQDHCKIRLLVELKDLLKIETEVNKEQCK